MALRSCPPLLALSLLLNGSVAQADDPPQQLEAVKIDASAVLGFRQIPSQSYAVEPGADASSPLTDDLGTRLPGVVLTHEQGNPLQATLRYDGFSASPLLGTPQGLSVYLDGVRVNEPFGDVVNWDLIPRDALSDVELVPISDPVFGLNTLGGALLLNTHDGRSQPGGEFSVGVGSYGHMEEHLRQGGERGPWSWYVNLGNQRVGGWAPYSASDGRDFFGKLTHDTADSHIDFSYSDAKSRLAGSQAIPVEWLNTPTAIYSAPDTMDNGLNALNLGGLFRWAENWQLAARLYSRNSNQDSLNSDINADSAAPAAFNDTGRLRQRDRGLTLALHHDGQIAGLANEADIGINLDRQHVDYGQARQDAAIDGSRYVYGTGDFVPTVDLAVRNAYDSAYFSDRLSLTSWGKLSVGGNFERSRIGMTDRMGGALGGDHSNRRFNPSFGLDLHPHGAGSYFIRYAESMRMPMPVELTCASPDAPCVLPNVLVSDPDLKPVIAHSAQIGGRWKRGADHAQLMYTQTRLDDAIQFVSAQANTGQGYFTNVPRERFRTLALSLDGRQGRWDWRASLSRTLATYGSDFALPSPGNSGAASDGSIQVHSGDRLPDVPLWSLNLQAGWQATPRLKLTGGLQAYSSRYAQGDENNRDSHGPIPGYTVFDLGAEFKPASDWRISASVHNLFDRVYADFGQLGYNAFSSPGRSYSSDRTVWQPTQFVAPGAPRTLWLAVSHDWP